jgi:hypothetical protein
MCWSDFNILQGVYVLEQHIEHYKYIQFLCVHWKK